MPPRLTVASIVEGHGDVKAVPELIRRIVQSISPGAYARTLDPLRVSRSTLVRPGEIERAVEFAARKLAGQPGGVVLVLIDSDRDCAKTLAPQLLARASSQRSDIPVSLVLAESEFEAWFLAAAESLRGWHGLSQDLVPPADPQAVRDAKGWITRQLPRGSSYSETRDQAELAALFDFQAARSTNSFGKLYRELERLINTVGERDAE